MSNNFKFGGTEANQKLLLEQPVGLFVLFFTEMWERFSYYGMRVIFVLFLTMAVTGDNPGWGWDREAALSLLGTYASLVYITPIIGGWLADTKLGYRNAVAIGALLMTLGHASMAVETEMSLYLGIAFLIIGNGFFKPNITSIISKMYDKVPEKKDGAYTIFYMGVNAGAFLGIMLCGYFGEKVSWSIGFGLAGIFMFLGMLQFWFAKPIFGDLGAPPSGDKDLGAAKTLNTNLNQAKYEDTTDTEDVLDADGSKNAVADAEAVMNPFTQLDKILIAVSAILGFVWVLNDPLTKIGGINLFGSDTLSNIAILTAVVLFFVLVFMRIPRYSTVVRDRMIAVAVLALGTVFFWWAFEQAAGSMNIFARDYTDRALVGTGASAFKIVDAIVTVVPLAIISYVLISLFGKTFKEIPLSNTILGISFLIVWGCVGYKLYNEYTSVGTEVPASWFNILNSLYIIMFAPLFSKWWDSKYNPSAGQKYAYGLILLGIGFAFVAYGSAGIPKGAETAAVGMVWLVIAYLFHTLGELCLSPVGLSYVSKLVPGRMIAFMFGVWYLAVAIGNKMAHLTGGLIDPIVKAYSMSTFFLIFTLIPIGVGVILFLLAPRLKKLMHGVH